MSVSVDQESARVDARGRIAESFFTVDHELEVLATIDRALDEMPPEAWWRVLRFFNDQRGERINQGKLIGRALEGICRSLVNQ